MLSDGTVNFLRASPCGGLLSGNAAHWIEGEAQFVERWGEEVWEAVIRLGARTGSEDSQCGAVESGDERVTGDADDVAGTDLSHTPEGGIVLQNARC
ncbi:hypothetical protein [Streptomyces sp. NPDC000994]